MNETPLQIVERIYGKEPEGATLEQCATYLKKIGYPSLAELLYN